MRWLHRIPSKIGRSKICAVITIVISLAGVQSSQAAVPPDAGAVWWPVSPLRLDVGDTMRIEPIYPYPSDLSIREAFAQRLRIRIEQ